MEKQSQCSDVTGGGPERAGCHLGQRVLCDRAVVTLQGEWPWRRWLHLVSRWGRQSHLGWAYLSVRPPTTIRNKNSVSVWGSSKAPSPPGLHILSLSHAYPECTVQSKDVGQQGSLPLNFSGGSHGSDQFSPVFFFFFLTSNQSKNAHNSSLILWDEAKSGGRSVRARYPGWPFVVFWLWNVITKYDLKENVFYSIEHTKKYISKSTILSSSNHCTVLMHPVRSCRCSYIGSSPPPNCFPSRNIPYGRVVLGGQLL